MQHSIKTIEWKFREVPPSFLGFPTVKAQIKSPSDVFDAFKGLFTNQVRERFIVIWFSSSNNVIGYEIVTEGLLNSSLVCMSSEPFGQNELISKRQFEHVNETNCKSSLPSKFCV